MYNKYCGLAYMGKVTFIIASITSFKLIQIPHMGWYKNWISLPERLPYFDYCVYAVRDNIAYTDPATNAYTRTADRHAHT